MTIIESCKQGNFENLAEQEAREILKFLRTIHRLILRGSWLTVDVLGETILNHFQTKTKSKFKHYQVVRITH